MMDSMSARLGEIERVLGRLRVLVVAVSVLVLIVLSRLFG